MQQHRRVRHENAGVALITALSLLLLFLLLGTAYVRYMSLESDDAQLQLQSMRADEVALGGMRAGAAELQRLIDSGQTPPAELGPYTFPVHVRDDEDAKGWSESADWRAEVSISVADECAKINLNHTPRAVLEALPGIDRAAARKIRSSLPRDDGAEYIQRQAGARRWLTSVDDLLNNELLDGQSFAMLNKDLLTVYSVPDHANPGSYINVNSAPPAVLAAVLNIDLQTAKSVAARRPFLTLDEVAAAAGKTPAEFNVAPSTDAPDLPPAALGLASRCYRLKGTASLGRVRQDGSLYNTTTRRYDAVVYFPENGAPETCYWSETVE